MSYFYFLCMVVIGVDVGSLCSVSIWTIFFLGGVNDIFKKSVVLCCGPASLSIFLASFLAAASAFFLAFSALSSSDA